MRTIWIIKLVIILTVSNLYANGNYAIHPIVSKNIEVFPFRHAYCIINTQTLDTIYKDCGKRWYLYRETKIIDDTLIDITSNESFMEKVDSFNIKISKYQILDDTVKLLKSVYIPNNKYSCIAIDISSFDITIVFYQYICRTKQEMEEYYIGNKKSVKFYQFMLLDLKLVEEYELSTASSNPSILAPDAKYSK